MADTDDSIVGTLVAGATRAVEGGIETLTEAGEWVFDAAVSYASERIGEIDDLVSGDEKLDDIPAGDVSRIEANIMSSPDVLSYPIDMNNDPQNVENEFLHSVVFKILARSNSRVGLVAKSMNTGAIKEAVEFDTTNQNRLASENSEKYLKRLAGFTAATAGYAATKKIIAGNAGAASGEAVKVASLAAAGVAVGKTDIGVSSVVEPKEQSLLTSNPVESHTL